VVCAFVLSGRLNSNANSPQVSRLGALILVTDTIIAPSSHIDLAPGKSPNTLSWGTVLGHGTTVVTVQQSNARPNSRLLMDLPHPGSKDRARRPTDAANPQASLHGKLLCITKLFRYVDGATI